MKIDPISTTDPTNHDLLRMLVQVHECVEDGKKATKAAVARVAVKAEAAKTAAAKTSENVTAIQADVTAIQTAMGLAPGQKKVAGLSTPFKAFVRTAGATGAAMGGLLLAYRFVVAAWPSAWSFLVAFNHVVLSGKF